MQYRPLTASGQVPGVLAIMPQDLSYFNQPEQQIFLDVAVSQLQSGGMSVNKQWFSLEELIDGILQQLEFALGNRHIEVHISENRQFIYTDELLLARVLINLLKNAINHSPKNSPLRIEVEAGNTNRFLIRVIDSGEGVPSEQQEMIFERFTRGNSESTVTGLGLGFALSRDLLTSSPP